MNRFDFARVFRDRDDAAQQLVTRLQAFRGQHPLVLAALHGLRARQPARLICAVPVASPSALEAVRPLVDEVVCLQAPPGFEAVGQFYRAFPQVDDDEVVALLTP